MEFTGIAGQILSFAVLITAYTTLLLGIVCIWHYVIMDWLLLAVVKMFGHYKLLLEYVINKAEFKQWQIELQNDERIATQQSMPQGTEAGNQNTPTE
jgi:predicted membrane protein